MDGRPPTRACSLRFGFKGKLCQVSVTNRSGHGRSGFDSHSLRKGANRPRPRLHWPTRDFRPGRCRVACRQTPGEIGRASCRERVVSDGAGVLVEEKDNENVIEVNFGRGGNTCHWARSKYGRSGCGGVEWF